MSKVTQTKLNRRVFKEIDQGKHRKPLLVPTGEILPAQGKQIVEHDLKNGYTITLALSPGQVINVTKLIKRMEAGERPSWVVQIRSTPEKNAKELPQKVEK